MSVDISSFLSTVESQRGDRYVLGGTGPSGFDCSGLIFWALAKQGVSIGRTSEEQYAGTQRISRSQLMPGDLVFTQWPGDNSPPGHVEVYTGGGQVFGAEDPQLGVTSHSISVDAGHIVGYGRISGGTDQATLTSFNPLDPTSWVQEAASVIPGWFNATSWADMAERIGIIVLGGLLVLLGLWIFAGPLIIKGIKGTTETVQKVSSKTNKDQVDRSVTLEES